ncbi:hypothetical protein ACFVUS_27865 [Nocardia sp. NPDC058058]|uniref:hypothetical protein n=1 Tax=Nocardia sp. NPDC058058 TaxID=3346317 RepID=UPI0036DBB041
MPAEAVEADSVPITKKMVADETCHPLQQIKGRPARHDLGDVLVEVGSLWVLVPLEVRAEILASMIERDRAVQTSEPTAGQVTRDIRSFAALRLAGFEGPEWEKCARALIKNATGVLEAWMRSGHLLKEFKSKRIIYRPSSREAERMLRDGHYRQSLINIVVAIGLQTFRERCLRGTGWRPERGASLATYFLTGCLHATANELHKQRRADERERKSFEAALHHEITESRYDRRVASDPSDAVSDHLILHEHLAQLTMRDRNIVWGKACGYSYRQIAEFYGEPSARKVEQRWTILTRNVPWIRRLSDGKSK